MAHDYRNLKRFEKSQINGLTKHLGGLRWNKEFQVEGSYRMNIDKVIEHCKSLDLTVGYNESNLPGEKFVFNKPRKITNVQTQLGKTWLKDYFFKLDGTPRKGKRTEYVSGRVLKIAKNVSRFEFIGVLGVMDQSWSVFQQYIPIYRTYDRKGNYFDYAPVHWGQPIIMES